MNKFSSTLLAQSNDPQEIQKADLDLLKKINELAININDTTSEIQVPIVTGWTPFDVQFGAATTAPTLNAAAIKQAAWRRVGNSVEVQIQIYQAAAGTAGSGTYYIIPPFSPWSGYSLGVAEQPNQVLGTAYFKLGTVNTIGVVRLNDNGQLYVNYFSSTATGGHFTESTWSSGSFAFSNAGLNVSMFFTMRVNEWTTTTTTEPIIIRNFEPVTSTTSSSITTNTRRQEKDEFFSAVTGTSNWVYTAIASGTFATTPAAGIVNDNHPGVIFIRSSTTANAGVHVRFSTNTFPIRGGERMTFIFRTVGVVTNRTIRAGIHNSITATAPTDGIYIWQIGANMGWTVRSNNITVAEETFTNEAVINTWYRGVLEISENKLSTRFILYRDDTDQLIFDRTYSGVLTAALMSPAFVATESSTTASDVCYLDYIDIEYNKPKGRN